MHSLLLVLRRINSLLPYLLHSLCAREIIDKLSEEDIKEEVKRKFSEFFFAKLKVVVSFEVKNRKDN
jgi:hypothetical protein